VSKMPGALPPPMAATEWFNEVVVSHICEI
jgi:hypothetical protein